MELCDIRYGDIVDYNGIIVKISLITDAHLVVNNIHTKLPYFVKLDELKPIKLTLEIIEKTGFKNTTEAAKYFGDHVYAIDKDVPNIFDTVFGEYGVYEDYNYNGYTFETWSFHNSNNEDGAPIDFWFECDNRIKHIHYVHELQHALTDSKIYNLEIKV